MTFPNRLRQDAGIMASPTVIVLAALIVITLGATAFLYLHQQGSRVPAAPAQAQTTSPGDGSTSGGAQSPRDAYEKWIASHGFLSRRAWKHLMDSNARIRLRYAWLAASHYSRNHRSFSGFSPAIADRLMKAIGADVTLAGEGSLRLLRFDPSESATVGVVSIRVAKGRDLLVVTRSRAGAAFCLVQRGTEVGVGLGNVHGVDACAIRWG